jgi:tRNA (adenine58-N1)-methyltransferase non-catalytic subunit
VNLAPVIGAPYGSVFELQHGKLVRVVSGGLKPVLDIGAMTSAMPENNNRELVDSNTAQKLSVEDIQQMQGDGKTGAEIIKALTESSDTYAGKTEFSKQKYLRRKIEK